MHLYRTYKLVPSKHLKYKYHYDIIPHPTPTCNQLLLIKKKTIYTLRFNIIDYSINYIVNNMLIVYTTYCYKSRKNTMEKMYRNYYIEYSHGYKMFMEKRNQIIQILNYIFYRDSIFMVIFQGTL